MRQALRARLAVGFMLSKGGLLLLLIIMIITIGPRLYRALSSSAQPAKVSSYTARPRSAATQACVKTVN